MDEGLLEPVPIHPAPPPRKPASDGAAKMFWAAVLLLVAGVLLLWLLDKKGGPPSVPVVPTPTPLPTPTPTPDPALRAAAEAALGEFMAAFTPLRAERADLWAPAPWPSVLEAQARGDAAMAAHDFPAAEKAYRAAMDRIPPVLAERPRAIPLLLRAAELAYANGEAQAAVDRLEAVLGIDPDHAAAKELLPRARVSDQSFARLSAAKAAAEKQEWAPAWVELEKLHAMDAAFPGGEALRNAVAAAIGAEEFEEWISGALQALTAGDIDRANDFLQKAAGFRPDHPAVRDLRAQVEAVRVQREVLDLRDAAETLEREEKWRQAHELWLRMKALDAQAPWINEGRDRTLRWKLLEERMTQAAAALRSPQAETLAKEIPDIDGMPPGLRKQADAFVRAWTLQHTPVTVRLISDLETRITLQRVRRWAEPFREQVVELKPGSYVATGTRLGYRDVRVAFEVKPGAAEMVVEIRCTEGI